MFVVKEPILTEKGFAKIKQGVYVFKVERSATKPRIKAEVEYIFNVKVRRVNTLRDPLRRKRMGRFVGFKSHFKRAIVYLEEGNSITIYPEDQSQTTSEPETLETNPAPKKETEELKKIKITPKKSVNKAKKASKGEEG